MYYVSKTMEISASHHLNLDYPSKCARTHGHNWKVIVHCKSKDLNQNGMVIDFTHIKEVIHNLLDHDNLNEILEFNPTAENIAKWVCEQIIACWKVEIWESEGNYACYMEDDF